MAWYLIGALFIVGLYGVVSQRNMIKKIMGLSIASSSIVLLFVYFGSVSGATAPIMGSEEPMVDPLPQALMLTAIVVSICVVSLALLLVYRLYMRHKTLDISVIEQRAWKTDE